MNPHPHRPGLQARCCLHQAMRAPFSSAPLRLSSTFPSRSIRRAGIPWMSNRPARPGFSWVLTWTNAHFPASSWATSRTTGANRTQWGHQGAQNSATITPGYPATKESKLRSVNATGRM